MGVIGLGQGSYVPRTELTHFVRGSCLLIVNCELLIVNYALFQISSADTKP